MSTWKGCSISSVIRKMQTKATSHQLGIIKIKMEINNCFGEYGYISYIAGRSAEYCSHYGKQFVVPQIVRHRNSNYYMT